MANVSREVIRLQQRFRVVLIGFVGLLLVVVGFVCLSLFKPVESATSPGTCLPVDKGGTGCDTLPLALGGTGAVNALNARANLGFATIGTGQTINTDMNGLQAAINSLPKFLANDVTINVTAGTTTGDIRIERFYGMGRLVIRAVDSGNNPIDTAGVQTHMANRITIVYNNIGYILVNGLTATTSDNFGFEIRDNSSMMTVNYCNAVAGSSATSTNIGMIVSYNSGTIASAICTFSNKAQAVISEYNRLIVGSNYGSGNTTVFRAQGGGQIHMRAVTYITGTTMYSTASSGVIFDVNGNQRGNGVNSATLTYAGCTFHFRRKGTTIQIQASYGSGTSFTSAVAAGQLMFSLPADLQPDVGAFVVFKATDGSHYYFLFEANGNFSAYTSVPSGASMPDTVTVLAGS